MELVIHGRRKNDRRNFGHCRNVLYKRNLLVRYFLSERKKLLTRLQQMLDRAIDGKLQRTEISEEKYSALENSMKQYLDNNFLAGKNQQEQKEVIQRLISDIAHQTLTPISNLKIYGEILSEAESENREEIDTILEQTEKLDFLIQSLVKLSRMESGIIAVHPAEIRVRQLLQTIQQEFAAKTSEKNIVLSVCDTDLQVTCDLKWTIEALGNIVDNAIKYTPGGGTVRIKAEQYSFFVRIDVIDDGIGMEKEEIPRIFGRFYRGMSVTDQPGVGIGLFLTREIVQAQKGYVKVKSEIGKGSMFSVFLPVSKNESYQNCDISETG
ncbi:Adaptive-response sensory-kinase SasA [Eubacterium plexicaudatum ASF492]|nr:Adaptive-response sensory-kinase SasA [Eubacterium plexicaudatum ASF492]